MRRSILDFEDLDELRNFRSQVNEPPIEILPFLPTQGNWTAKEYMLLIEKHGIEFTDGFLEILPHVTYWHQAAIMFIQSELRRFSNSGAGGKSCFYGLRLKLPKTKVVKYRLPDILFVSEENKHWTGNRKWTGADMVMELVIPESRDRDLTTKRGDYAEAKIPEYWIIDSVSQSIVVLKLEGSKYVDFGVFNKGERAHSAVLKGFSLDVSEVFAAD